MKLKRSHRTHRIKPVDQEWRYECLCCDYTRQGKFVDITQDEHALKEHREAIERVRFVIV
jgi:hypothetical protein